MGRSINFFSMVVLLGALVACKGTQDASPNQTSAPSAQNSPTAVGVFGIESIVGVYAGVLPCGDCKGVITTLEILPEGAYKVHEVFDGRSENTELKSEGKVSLDVTSRQIRLDPAASDWEDRLFEVTSEGSLRALDGNGVAYSSDNSADLVRK